MKSVFMRRVVVAFATAGFCALVAFLMLAIADRVSRGGKDEAE